MKRSAPYRLPVAGVLISLLAILPAAQAATNSAIDALMHGDCNGAVKSVNDGAGTLDPIALFVAGRMADEGLCVEQDAPEAARFFERAALLGHIEARYEQAAAVGMGEGFEQSYEKAGEICRAAGADPERRLSNYSLGYSCTLRALVGRGLRLTLPNDALPRPTRPAVVEFQPNSRDVRIDSIPTVNKETESATGSRIRKPIVDLRQMIDDAWRTAIKTAPPPDPSRLEDKRIELTVDLDTTFEAGVGMLKNADATDHPMRRLQANELTTVGGKVGH